MCFSCNGIMKPLEIVVNSLLFHSSCFHTEMFPKSNIGQCPCIYKYFCHKMTEISSMSLQEVFISSPFGMVSSFFYGTIQSALFTLLAVYATTMNFSIFQISF